MRRDGSIKIVKQRSEVYLDPEGRPTQILGTLQDITDQREAENLAARFGRILDRSFNEIYIFDSETLKFSKVNLAARLNLRYKMEELCEMTLEDLLPEFAWDKVQKLMASLKRGVESVTAFETVHERKMELLIPWTSACSSREQNPVRSLSLLFRISPIVKKVETFFNRAYEDIDKRVRERTLDLTKSNKDLLPLPDRHFVHQARSPPARDSCSSANGQRPPRSADRRQGRAGSIGTDARGRVEIPPDTDPAWTRVG